MKSRKRKIKNTKRKTGNKVFKQKLSKSNSNSTYQPVDHLGEYSSSAGYGGWGHDE